MSVTPYVGEIMLFAGQNAPSGWMFCEGQLLSTTDSDNLPLFSLIGNRYGGDIRSRTFKLPDLRGRAIINQGLSDRQIGDIGGTATQTVPLSAMPKHTHNIQTILGQLGDSASPVGRKLGAYKKVEQEQGSPYSIKEITSQPMSPSAIGVAGGGQPLNNLPPFLTMRYAIAVKGEFPSKVG